MRAIVFYHYGDTDVLQVDNVPEPVPGKGDILVRVNYSAVNPKDTFIRKGRFKRFPVNRFPQRIGFDFSGIVAESHHPSYSEGDAVFGMLEGWQGGSCAEYIVVKAHQLAKKPESIPFDQVASVPLVGLTALQALRDDAGIKSGDRVCINGASGGVGSMAVQIAKVYGAHVTAIASASNHEFLYSLGADICIDYRETDISTGDNPFDIFFDVFGNTRFARIKPLLSPTGTWVSTVIQAHVFISQALTVFSRKSAKLVVVKANPDDFRLLTDWMESAKVKAIIQDIFPMENTAVAHEQQQSKHTRGKLLIRID